MPRQRTDLIVNDIGDERVIFDPLANEAHKVSAQAAIILESCDGTSSMSEVATRLAVTEQQISVVCEELGAAGLLEAGSVERTGLSRRRALQGGTVAVGAALVGTVLIPRAAAAVSLHGPGGGGPVGGPGSEFDLKAALSGPTVLPPFSLPTGTGDPTPLAQTPLGSDNGNGGSINMYYGTESTNIGFPGFPFVGVVGPSAPWVYQTLDVPAGAIAYHPGPVSPAVIAFTNQFANATIEMSGSIIGRDDAGLGNGTTISFAGSPGVPSPTGTVTATNTGATGNAASFDATFAGVPAGGVIYIELSNNGSYFYDGSELDINIVVS
jgi:hypothetical protein